MQVKTMLIAAILSGATPMTAQASGSESFPSGSHQSFPELRDPYQQAYDAGRRTLRREITCKKCPFPDGVKDRETAFAVIEKIQMGEIVLSEEKSTNLVVYLDRRFKLRSAN